MSARKRRQFQSLYDALHPVGCWRVSQFPIPRGIAAVWRLTGGPLDRLEWERIA